MIDSKSIGEQTAIRPLDQTSRLLLDHILSESDQYCVLGVKVNQHGVAIMVMRSYFSAVC